MKRNKNLKEDIKNSNPDNICCLLVSLKVSFRLYGNFHLKNGKYYLEFRKNNLSLLRRTIRNYNNAFDKSSDRKISYNQNEYWVYIEVNKKILEKLDIIKKEEFLPKIKVKNYCCKKTFLKEILLYKGYLFNFEDSYQLEVRVEDYFKKILEDILYVFNIKFYDYKDRVFIKGFKYLKKLFFLLGLKESLKDLLEFASYRQSKNKTVLLTNYTVANLNRQVESYEKYKKIIEEIDREIGIDNLSEKLSEIAHLRLSNPGATYSELGEKLEDNLSKGGVYKRLKKLEKIYNEIDRQ